MNLFAWFWGSIIKGHLLVLSIIIPFYVDVSSFGKPAIFHPWITTGTPIKVLIEIFSVWGILSYLSLFYQDFSILVLYSAVKGPVYAIIPALTAQFPAIFKESYSYFLTSFVHLTCSSDNPEISFLAL